LIKLYGAPKRIGTDNGKEFINILLNSFCAENNIEIEHGLPYKPHS